MKPLLVAVDFSELSERALAYAVEHAEGSERKIDLLHVAQDALPARAAAHAPPEVLEQIREAERAEDESEMARFLALLPDNRRGQGIIRRGPAAETICEVAGEGYGLLVLSTHGRTGLSQFFIGSVAERVVRFSPIPVLVVR